jgi:hypothetical protein
MLLVPPPSSYPWTHTPPSWAHIHKYAIYELAKDDISIPGVFLACWMHVCIPMRSLAYVWTSLRALHPWRGAGRGLGGEAHRGRKGWTLNLSPLANSKLENKYFMTLSLHRAKSDEKSYLEKLHPLKLINALQSKYSFLSQIKMTSIVERST